MQHILQELTTIETVFKLVYIIHNIKKQTKKLID